MRHMGYTHGKIFREIERERERERERDRQMRKSNSEIESGKAIKDEF